MLRADDFPRVAVLEPLVRAFDLVAVHDVLRENSELVADAVPVTRIIQRRERVQKARRQSPEAPIPKARVRLDFEQLVQVDAVRLERLLRGVVQPHVHQVVAERPPEQVLGGEVVGAFHIVRVEGRLGRDPTFRQLVSDCQREREETVVRGRVFVRLPARVAHVLQKRALQGARVRELTMGEIGKGSIGHRRGEVEQKTSPGTTSFRPCDYR